MVEKRTPSSPYAPYTAEMPARGASEADATKAPTQEELAAFVSEFGNAQPDAKAGGTVRVVEPGTGEIKEEPQQQEAAMTEATLQKVAAFLDPTSHGPITLLAVRHKLFAMRIPTQQEILDVTAIMGARAGDDNLTAAQAQWSIIGELRKATYGWVGEVSPEAQLLRANIAWPKKWPKLNEPRWTESRDPYLFTEEIIPLWTQYLAWRTKVVPTRAEIDFYWASQR